jgi:tRNA pseudouridine38-40 synthase
LPTFKITLMYDGGSFVGWQRQATGVSVQGLVEDALRELDGADVTVHGAGRTDAGVHALGQVASFMLHRATGADVVLRALNHHLPDEIRVIAAEEVAPSFHARFGARSKTYRYRILCGEVASPFGQKYAWCVRGPLAVDAMQDAAATLVGRHDFASFRAAESARRTTEREVHTSTISVQDDPWRQAPEASPARLVTYEISGSGFLRYMVRAIVGSLVEIGSGRRKVAWLGDVLTSRDRTRAGPTAPAHGLFLVRVEY